MMPLALAPLLQASPAHTYVIAQLGQSLDGRIATHTGESLGINGPDGLTHLHALRAHVDAVVVGAGTITADNPRLNVRHVQGRNPARVVLDPSGRISQGHWLAEDGKACYHITARPHKIDRATNIILPVQDGMFDPHAICAALFERGLKKLLIEGGARTISHFMDHNCVDRLHIICAPLLMGAGLHGLNLRPPLSLAHALRPKVTLYPFADGDILFDCDLRHNGSPQGVGHDI